MQRRRGSRPSGRNCGAKASRVARLNPPNETGVAMSTMRISPPAASSNAGAGFGNTRVRSRSPSETDARWTSAGLGAVDTVTISSSLHDVYEKTGRSGTMTFLVVRVTLTNQRGELLAKVDNRLMYRGQE